MNAYFVTGTDTGVGKTVATCALARGHRARGQKVCLHKPIETGGRADIDKLSRCANNTEFLFSYIFTQPLAPNVAAKIDKQDISWNLIIENIKKVAVQGEVTFVEGAGGLLVPITNSKTYLDLIKELELKTIVVAANKLGVINHFSLTLEVLAKHGASVEGFIVSEVDEMALESNRAQLQRVASAYSIPEIGYLRHQLDTTSYSLCLKE